MKKILFFTANLLTCIGIAGGAVRDGTAVSRTKNEKNTPQVQSRTATTVKRSTSPRTTTLVPRSGTTPRTSAQNRLPAATRAATSRTNTKRTNVVSRAASDNTATSMSETRTGAEYERCKNTYFACMDQFCKLKNDDYRRCSCNDRVFDLADKRKTLTDAGEQLTIFTENLEAVGMTAAQAAAMKTESDGESALTNDTSTSKALLQAIMNSIRGANSDVSGKMSNLNSINMSFDTTNAFGTADVGQTIAAYNGAALYTAVYPQCRDAVRNDCNNSSLQRAVTAYLMAIEQDCNTVQTAIEKTQKQMKSAVREGSAMLDLARVENRKKHNSSDITTCINEVEAAILSEEVCGANYHKCLDNGQYIDISTGKPIIGVKDFYKLEQLLTFTAGIDAADQKLSQNKSNRPFVQNFETHVKKFAADALDKCVENADIVWAEYLDKALLSIYYAQQDKVSEIKQNCFDYITECYVNTDQAIKAAQSQISDKNALVLKPDSLILNKQMCTDYIKSCNGMFADNIIQEYVENINNQDIKDACRAVARQCFDNYGGLNYQNFFYPYSGTFAVGEALSWFVYQDDVTDNKNKTEGTFFSQCAQQLQNIPACSEKAKDVFGGFDRQTIINDKGKKTYTYTTNSAGVATEVYNQIIATLSTQCKNIQGNFITLDNIKEYYSSTYMINSDTTESDPCKLNTKTMGTNSANLISLYHIYDNENICPQNYKMQVDTTSWGICSCWDNGGRRSNNGTIGKCTASSPAISREENTTPSNAKCDPSSMGLPSMFESDTEGAKNSRTTSRAENWCELDISQDDQVCPFGYIEGTENTEGTESTEGNKPVCKPTDDYKNPTPTCPNNQTIDEKTGCGTERTELPVCPTGYVLYDKATTTDTCDDTNYTLIGDRCYTCTINTEILSLPDTFDLSYIPSVTKH